jgi:hypothetical protein
LPLTYKCCAAGGGPGGTGLDEPPHAVRHVMKAAMNRKSTRREEVCEELSP